jgi:hypothetical protein
MSVHLTPYKLRIAACRLRHCARDLCCELTVYLVRGGTIAEAEQLLELAAGALHEAREMEEAADEQEAASCRV